MNIATENISLTVSSEKLARAFTEWDRRYREDPAQFDSDVRRILAGQTIEEYGDAATATLLFYLEATE